MAQIPSQTQIAGDSVPPEEALGDRDRPIVLLLIGSGSDLAHLGPQLTAATADYQCLEADTAAKALDLWHASSPDWAILDLAWAIDSGPGFLAALGQSDPTRPLPVVVLVDRGQERAALDAMKLGAADCLFKAEFTAAALKAMLSQPPPRYLPAQAQPPTAAFVGQARQPYQNLVEHSPDIIERFDCNLRHLYVSPVLTEITGIEATAFLGKSCRELGLDEAMVNSWEAAAKAALATGEKQAIEFATPTLKGVRHFEMVLAPEWSAAGGEIESILCISRDISDRVIAQQAQRQQLTEAQVAQQNAAAARDMLTQVLDRINDGIIAFDRNSRCVYLNPSAGQTLGKSAAELIGQHIWTEFPETVNTPVYAAFHRAMEQQQPEFLESYWLPQRGWFEVRLYPDASGITIYLTDISDRKVAEASGQQTEQLRHELTLLEQMLDSALAGYWDFDFQHNTAYYSPGLKAIFGYADDELPNQFDTWQRLIFAEDIPRVQTSLDRHIQSRGEVLHYLEVRFRHKNGSPVWVLCAGQAIGWDEAGQPLRMVGCHVDITPLKQTEAQLRKNEAHLQAAQRIGKLGSWEFELATEQIVWSEQVYRIFGLPVNQRPPSFEMLQSHYHPDDRDRHRQIVEATIATHQPYDDEFRIVGVDGRLSYIHVKGEAVVDIAGQITHLTGTVQDITDRKEHEVQMQSLSLRLSLALESGCIGSWERMLSTDEVIWDQCLVDLYGFEQLGHQATYQDWRAQVYADDLPWVEVAHQALLDSNAPYDVEFRIWRGDGSLGWIRSSALVNRDSQGQPLSVIGINYDITDRKQAAAELQNLSARLSLALESGGFGSWEWDLDTDVVHWDQRLIDLYGFEQLGRSATYQDWRSRIYSADLPAVEADLRATIDNDVPYDVEFRIYRRDGELRWIRSTALVQRDEQGRPQRLIGTNSDITEAKQTEQHLLHTTSQLEVSNQELEAFAYSVSHDLRAPLRAIDGFSRAILEDYGDQFDPEGQDYFNRIRRNVSRMGQLIDDLLRLSRVSRQAMAYEVVNLSALVQEQIDELRTNDPDRTVTVSVTPGIAVSADKTLMRIAIANLVQNAWKFTAQCPSAEIEFGVMMPSGEPIYYLRDNGVGFDMAYANKLFGVFQRLHNTDEFPGTGVGLATVQRAIHRQGGRVWAVAAVDRGATFYFTLPQFVAGAISGPIPRI